jgi:two-component system, NarL family, sensor histidine kinase BarA
VWPAEAFPRTRAAGYDAAVDPSPGAVKRRDVGLLALAALPLAAAILCRGAAEQPWPPRAYLAIHLVMEVLVVVAAAATFAVQWYAAGARLNDARARFLGAAFLAVAILEVAHVLAFPGMPGLVWLDSSTERGIVYWLSARWWTVGALLAATAIRPASEARLLRRGPLLAAALGGVALLLVADRLWIAGSPIFFVEGRGLTAEKRVLEALVAAVAVVGAVAYGRLQARGDRSAGTLARALAVTVLSEACFTFYAHAYDSFNLLGHAYLLAASYAVFHALFADAVLEPHERLASASRALADSNAELRRLREHVEGELAVTIRKLEALQEQREDFVRAVSHDLRTPLQVVMLQADRLVRRAAAETRERGWADAIRAASRQMAAMLQDLVDSIHLESGTLPLAREPVGLASVVDEFLGVAEGVEETDRVVLRIPADLPSVAADRARLTRVVQNLVGNALKYSTPGTRVDVRAWAADGEVVLAVSDQGPGIPPDDVPRLFERFYRGERRAKGDGLGLGLYITRLVVEAHGGRIWCESRVGEGSTFALALPSCVPARA